MQASSQIADSSNNNIDLKTEDVDVLKLLNECMANINKYTQIVFCIGTSCDSRKLRSKLNSIHDKLFKNIFLQKESIRVYFKNLQADSAPNKNTKTNENELSYSEKIERLLCFTLTALAHLEKMIQKLTHLMELFPTSDKIPFVVDLGFDDTFINNLTSQEVVVTNETLNMSLIAENDHMMNNLKNRLKTISNLREEIELMDVNLVRYHIKNESNLFMKKVLECNDDMDQKDKYTGKLRSIKSGPQVPNFKRFISNRKKCIFTILMIIFLIVIVVSIACGLVYGL